MKFELVNIDEFSGEMAQIYSVIFEGDDMTLMDHFFEDNAQYKEELTEMAKKLISMGNAQAVEFSFLKKMKALLGMGLLLSGINACVCIVCE